MKPGKLAVFVLAIVFAGFAFAQQQEKGEKKAVATVKMESKVKMKDAAQAKNTKDACASDTSAAKGGHDCCGKK
jgi:hypothetical protein